MKSLSKKKLIWLAVAVAVVWVGYRGVRAHSHLVTLNVQDEELQKVVHRIEWQTWEPVLVHREVRARVSLQLKNVPLADALEAVAKAAHCRYQILYPLYSSKRSLKNFKLAAQGELEPSQVAWTNVLGVLQPMMPGPMDEGPRAEEPVTIRATNSEMRLVTVAFSRFANIQVVPEDGTLTPLSLTVESLPAPQAVQALAKTVYRHTRGYYSLLPGMDRGPGPGDAGPPDMAQNPDFPPGGPPPGGPPPFGPEGGPGGPPMPGGGPHRPQPPREDMQKQMDQDFQALMGMLPQGQATRLAAERQGQMAQQSGGSPRASAQQSSSSSSASRSAERAQGLRTSSVADRVKRDRGEKGN